MGLFTSRNTYNELKRYLNRIEELPIKWRITEISEFEINICGQWDDFLVGIRFWKRKSGNDIFWNKVVSLSVKHQKEILYRNAFSLSDNKYCYKPIKKLIDTIVENWKRQIKLESNSEIYQQSKAEWEDKQRLVKEHHQNILDKFFNG